MLITIALISLAYCSFFEWVLHREVMHKPVRGFKYPFNSHALVHHRLFKADESYHLIRQEDKKKIPMAWWNGPALVLIGSLPFLVLSFILNSWMVLVTEITVAGLYYGAYEYFHWCMHCPLRKKRLVERSWVFFRLNGHHLLHHRYMNRNFNVVLPFADLIFGTLLLRSPIRFAQARGPSVPDVQPLS